jgi:hypothetical protein
MSTDVENENELICERVVEGDQVECGGGGLSVAMEAEGKGLIGAAAVKNKGGCGGKTIGLRGAAVACRGCFIGCGGLERVCHARGGTQRQ